MTLPEVHRSVRLSDVVVVLRDLRPGWYVPGKVYDEYMSAAELTGGNRNSFGRVLTMLGVGTGEYRPEIHKTARFIDPAALAARWPDLDWRLSDPDDEFI
jgi:hypothetical protein